MVPVFGAVMVCFVAPLFYAIMHLLFSSGTLGWCLLQLLPVWQQSQCLMQLTSHIVLLCKCFLFFNLHCICLLLNQRMMRSVIFFLSYNWFIFLNDYVSMIHLHLIFSRFFLPGLNHRMLHRISFLKGWIQS